LTELEHKKALNPGQSIYISVVKAKAYNTYTAPHTAAVAAILCHRAGVQPIGHGPSFTHGLWPATKQPYLALICRIMVSTPVIHVITTHLPTPADGRLSWPGWLTQRTLYSQWHAVYCCMFRKRQTLSRRQKKELTENR